MSTISELFQQGRHEELWQRCCGFIDLSIDEFMRIQRQLLLEQLGLLKKSELGQTVMRGMAPRNVDEFRELIPLTTYEDYAPYLLKRKMKGLPRKPTLWQYTCGKSGEYAHRWVPVTARQLDEIEPLIFALFCSRRASAAVKWPLTKVTNCSMAWRLLRTPPARWRAYSRLNCSSSCRQSSKPKTCHLRRGSAQASTRR